MDFPLNIYVAQSHLAPSHGVYNGALLFLLLLFPSLPFVDEQHIVLGHALQVRPPQLPALEVAVVREAEADVGRLRHGLRRRERRERQGEAGAEKDSVSRQESGEGVTNN